MCEVPRRRVPIETARAGGRGETGPPDPTAPSSFASPQLALHRCTMAPTSTRTLFWTPTAQQIEESPDTLFREWVNRRLSLRLRDYDELHAWSITNLDAFWTLATEYTGVLLDRT